MGITQIEKNGKLIFRNEFQPTLEDGTPIGGTQVVEADTLEALIDAQNNNYRNLYLKNRDLLAAQKLADKNAPDGAEVATPTAKLKPRPFTVEEKIRLSHAGIDPERADEIGELIVEAKLGGKPATVANKIDDAEGNNEAVRAREEAIAFTAAHPEIYWTQRNKELFTNWIQNKGLKYRFENFEKALADLAALLDQAPVGTGNQAESQPNTSQSSALMTPKPEVPNAAPIPTTPTRRQTSPSEGVPTSSLSRKQIYDMPDAEYKRRLKDPAFMARVNELFSSAR